MTKPLRIALTGATGFIGRRLTGALLERGHSVRAIVRDRARAASMSALDRCSFFELNLDGSELDASSLDAALDGVDVLCHSAAWIPKDLRDARQASLCLRVNALATLSFVEACVARNTPRMLYFSSANVYTPSAALVTEDAPTYPASRATYYLASKLCGELYVEHRATQRRALDDDAARVFRLRSADERRGRRALRRSPRARRASARERRRTLSDRPRLCRRRGERRGRRARAAFDRRRDQRGLGAGDDAARARSRAGHALESQRRRDRGRASFGRRGGSWFCGGGRVARARTLLDYAPRSLHEGLRAWLAER
jgi:nucleoside-diphosphate-sugar epimerase